jgi:ATP-dependent DNA ligase
MVSYAFDILTLDGEDLRPLPLSLRKTNLARLLARRPFSCRQARVPFGGTVLASVAGEQPRGPQFMRIT